jgi:hypothetical protein
MSDDVSSTCRNGFSVDSVRKVQWLGAGIVNGRDAECWEIQLLRMR